VRSALVYDSRVRRGRLLPGIAVSLIAAWSIVPAEATSVVALRLGDTILLGADSKQSLAIGTSQNVCKIAQGEGCFFAVIGPAWDPKHDLYRLGRSACASAAHIEEKTSNFFSLLREPFEEMYTWASQRAPNSVGKSLTVVLVGQNNGRPVGFSSSYRIEPARDPQLKPISELADGQILIAGGDSVRQFVTQAMRSAPPDGQLVRRAIAFDAASRPREVGGPTSILEVDRAGARWVEPGLCPPIDPALWR
jgi:hypothetical protein